MVAELTASSLSLIILCDGTGVAVVIYCPTIDFNIVSVLGDNTSLLY